MKFEQTLLFFELPEAKSNLHANKIMKVIAKVKKAFQTNRRNLKTHIQRFPEKPLVLFI